MSPDRYPRAVPKDGRELGAAQLTDAELVAVEQAMHAVVSSDADRIRPMLDASRHPTPEAFLTWADDYGDQGSRTLVVPPGSPSSWDICGVRMKDGGVALDLEVWASTGRTDLTLSLTLHQDADGSPHVELDDLHVL